MEKFEAIVSRLDKVKGSGDSVRACCPVHGSKGQTLSITAKGGGYIVAHCFSCGAGGPELVKALGLPLALLFPDDDYTPPTVNREMRRKNIEDGLTLQAPPKSEPTLAEYRARIKARERAKGYELKAEQAEEEAPPISHPALDPFKAQFRQALEQSPALRSELVASYWDGVADRAHRRERRIIDTAAAFSGSDSPYS